MMSAFGKFCIGCVLGVVLGSGSRHVYETARQADIQSRPRPTIPALDDNEGYPIWWDKDKCQFVYWFDYSAAWYCEFEGRAFVFTASAKGVLETTFAPATTLAVTSTVNTYRRNKAEVRLSFGK